MGNPHCIYVKVASGRLLNVRACYGTIKKRLKNKFVGGVDTGFLYTRENSVETIREALPPLPLSLCRPFRWKVRRRELPA